MTDPAASLQASIARYRALIARLGEPVTPPAGLDILQRCPPIAEHLSREGAYLHRAERMAGRTPTPRRSLLWLAAACLALGLLAIAAQAAEPLTLTAPDRSAALRAALRIADAQPYLAGVRLPAGTQSMWPTLDAGCYVVLSRRPWADFRAGDIGAFRRAGDRYATMHRATAEIDSRAGKMVITRGDNNNTTDPGYYGAVDYLGTVVAIVRFESVPRSHPISFAAWQRREAKHRHSQQAGEAITSKP